MTIKNFILNVAKNQLRIVKIRDTTSGSFYQERLSGNTMTWATKTHMHVATRDENGRYILIANATTSPKASLETISLGPGLILDPESPKNQYMVTNNSIMTVAEENMEVVPEGTRYIENNMDKLGMVAEKSVSSDKPIEVYDRNKLVEDFYSNLKPKKIFDIQKEFINDCRKKELTMVKAELQGQVEKEIKIKAPLQLELEDKAKIKAKTYTHKKKEDKINVIHPAHKVKKKIKTPLEKEKMIKERMTRIRKKYSIIKRAEESANSSEID